MKILLVSLAVGAAGFVGSLARWGIGRFFGQMNLGFPVGTLFVNLTGSLFLGWFLTHAARHQLSDATRATIAVGFVGTYTTFSTYMFESNSLLKDGHEFKACLNLFGSLLLGIICVRIGIWLGQYT
jgi:fluoride exporter